MKSEIDESEAELAHLGVGGAEIARAHHLLEQIPGNWLASLEVPREKIQSLAFPAPVFHDLRRQLDEIPSHVRTSEAAYFHLAEAVMQQVPEFVENGLDLTVCEQGRPILPRRSEIAANEPGVRLEAIAERDSGNKGVHPGAASFGFAREPVGVEGSDQGVVGRTGLVVNLVVLDS